MLVTARRISKVAVMLWCATAFLAQCALADDVSRNRLPQRWWESASAVCRMTLKTGTHFPQLSLDPEKIGKELDRLREEGISILEIFGPADGGKSYAGLDARNRYRLDPELGTMDDFRRLVRLAHSRGLAVITFDNLGYSAVDSPDFLKASDDVREGGDSKEAHWYIWSEQADAPPPALGDSYFFVRPKLPGYDAARSEFWKYSERARHYYWTKWRGVDVQGKHVQLPQYDWRRPEWPEEAERVVRFWMDTGIDGMVVDAVNWYVGYTWEKGHQRITDVISSYGNTYSQPEGAGGFHEDPVAWITEGGWKSVQDYGLGIWWERGNDLVYKAIDSGDPRPLEPALRDYHDRVVAAGGTLYEPVTRLDDPAKQRLAVALVATIGDLVCFCNGRNAGPEPEDTWILRMKQQHTALQQLSIRRRLPTNADDKYYAFLRTAADGSERVLVVLNFQPTTQGVEIDLSGVAAKSLTELGSGKAVERQSRLKTELPAYGYRLYEVSP
ncbi:MAG: alpha-amylase family glycosyl hydrolase [Terriglobia bacterium]